MERLRAEAEARIADVETSLSKLGTEMDELKATEDNRRSIDARVEEHAKNLSYLLERVEFVRSELLFELRYGSGKDVAASAEDAIPVVKIELPQSDVKVNLGCGHLPLQGYVNVDNRDLPTVDVVADVMKLPFDRGSVSEFFSSHFLEHFPEERLRRKVLPYLLSLLQPGGQFRAVVPDAEAMIQRYVAGTYPYEDLKDVIYGGQDYDGDFHFTMFTPASISSLLQEIGFAEVAVAHSGRVNGRALELEVHAIRPTEDK